MSRRAAEYPPAIGTETSRGGATGPPVADRPALSRAFAQRRQYAAAVVLALCAVAYLYKRWPPTTANSDFASIFYGIGRQVLHGHLHYVLPKVYTEGNESIYRYPPIAGVLMAPFALFKLHTAVRLWWSVGVAALALSAWWMSALLIGGRARRAALAGVLLLFFALFDPVGWANQGQVDVWVLALVAAAFALSTRGDRRSLFTAGALLGVLGAMKVYPLLTLAVIVWFRRDEARALLAGAAAAIVACVVVPIAILGFGPTGEYFHVISTQGDPVLAAFPYAFGFLNIADRLFVATPWVLDPGHASPTLIKALFVLFVAASLLYVAFAYRRVNAARGAVWSVALLVTVVCSPFLEVQHLAPLALIPAMLATDRPDRRSVRWSLPAPIAERWPIGLALLVCALLAFVFSNGILIGVSLFAVLGLVGFMLRPRTRPALLGAIFAGSLLVVGAPAFWNVSGYGGAPMTQLHVLLGTLVFDCLVLITLVGPWTFAPASVPATASRSPGRRRVAA